jgi:hypothetical protein
MQTSDSIDLAVIHCICLTVFAFLSSITENQLSSKCRFVCVISSNNNDDDDNANDNEAGATMQTNEQELERHVADADEGQWKNGNAYYKLNSNMHT